MIIYFLRFPGLKTAFEAEILEFPILNTECNIKQRIRWGLGENASGPHWIIYQGHWHGDRYSRIGWDQEQKILHGHREWHRERVIYRCTQREAYVFANERCSHVLHLG